MLALLNTWQCQAYGANSIESAKQVFSRHGNDISILLVDYQLDNDENGLQLIKELRAMAQTELPAILITATTDPYIQQKTDKAGVGYMKKMVKPAALRAMMSSLLAQRLKANYSQK